MSEELKVPLGIQSVSDSGTGSTNASATSSSSSSAGGLTPVQALAEDKLQTSRRITKHRYGWRPDKHIENMPIFKADPSRNLLDPFGSQPTPSASAVSAASLPVPIGGGGPTTV
jgi:hypothetical protein